MRKNKPLDKSRKTSQTLGTKIAFYSIFIYKLDLLDNITQIGPLPIHGSKLGENIDKKECKYRLTGRILGTIWLGRIS
ncbi:hypothetical protein Hanom_Chr00s000006g01614301 [Helianthus anomalus]